MGRSRKAATPRVQDQKFALQTGIPATAKSGPATARRSALLGTVTAGLLLFGYGREARAQVVPPAAPCDTVSGATVTCTGNVSAGIEIDQYGAPPDTFDTLIVNNVTGDITPATGVVGIYFGSDGNVTINSDTTDGPGGPFSIITTGDGAHGIEAYSYDGTADVTHRGDIRTDGYAAMGIYADGYEGARVTHRGKIETQGDYAFGILGVSYYDSVVVNQRGTIETTGYSADGIRAEGFTSARVTQTGDISTRGDYAAGIAARSYYTVNITQTGTISTRGDFAPGVIGQSFFGSVAIEQSGSISTRGFASYGLYGFSYFGAIDIQQSGKLTTRGAYADGIYTFTSGKTTITVSGDIDTKGAGADGIDVNHPFDYGSSRVVIKAGSTVTGGTASGDGIDFDGGATNRVINYGTITTRGENAIEGEGPGDEIIDNYGTVTGNVHLGPGANRFNNRSGGVFNPGGTAYIGAGNLFRNAGTLSPGGAGAVKTTALTGNMVQTSGGSLAVDLNLGAKKADRVNVSGTAKLDGTVDVTPKNPARINQEFVILSADGGVTNQGLALGPVSPALQAVLLFPNANDVVLGVDVDFVASGLNRNQTAIARNLNRVLGAGGGTLGPVFNGLFNVFTLEDYTDALDQLSPEIYADIELAAVYTAFDFSDNLLSCQVNGADTASINREGQCLWVGAKGRYLEGDETFEDIGFDETAGQFAAGGQVALNDVWRLGAGLGYQRSSLSTESGAYSDGDQLQGGVALKYNPGALLLAGAFSGAHGWYDTTRPMNFGGYSATARSDHDLDVLQGRLHASYVLGSPGLYYKPMLDAAVTDVDLGDVREHGAGGANLLVHGADHTVFTLSPALEVGTEWWWSNGTLVRPFVRAGFTWYSEDDVTVASSFSGAPGGVPGFTIIANTDDVQADVAAGIELISGDDSALRIFYDGQFGDRLAVHAAGFKASVKF